MDKTTIEKLLKEAGYGKQIISAVTAEELPEDFDIKPVLADYKTERLEFYTDTVKEGIEKEYEERVKEKRYEMAIKPILNRVTRLAGAIDMKEDIADLGIKEAIEKIEAGIKEKINSASQQTDEELRQKAQDFEAKYFDANRQIEELKESYEEKIETVKSTFQQERKEEKKNRLFREKVVNNPELKEIQFGPFREDAMITALGKYGLDILFDEEKEEIKIVGQGGGVPKTIDGTQRYDKFEEFFFDFAKANDLLPKHNGGKGGEDKSHTREYGGKKVSIAGTSFLEESMRGDE